MPTITSNSFNVNVSNNPHSAQTTYVDVATLLSKQYGKTIRQGNNFKITGISIAMIPKNTTNNFDTGMAISAKIGYCPTTKHTRKGWNEVNRMWKQQKKLRAGIGSAVKFDEMEFKYDSSHSYARVSTLYQSGLGDADADSLCLFGISSEGSNQLALQDFYNSRHPVATTSKYSYNNAEIKDRKYDSFFPSAQYVYASSVLSAAVAEAGEYPSAYLSAAQAQNPLTEFADPLNVMCGLLKVQCYVITDDTATQIEDEAYMQVSIHVKSWKSLMYKPRSTRRRKSGGRMYRRTNSRGGRRYSRRYSRGRRR